MHDDFWGAPIHVYTREEAIEDGALVDVTPTAREAGFTWPVAVTCGVWETVIAPDPLPAGQDAAGRLWDVLAVLRVAARAAGGERVDFSVLVADGDGRTTPAPLYAVVTGEAPGGGPCITILLPGED